MVKTVSFKNIGTGKSRSVTKAFKNIAEAYEFAHAECKHGEYVEHIV